MALMERDLIITPPENSTVASGFLSREEALCRLDKLKLDLERIRHEIEGPRNFAMLVGSDGTELKIPVHVYEVLLWVTQRMAEGEAFTLAPLHKELTTQQAADILNVSRPHLVKLLDRGDIPYTRTGTHRRVKLRDIMKYREERDRRTAKVLGEMAQEEKDWDL